MLLTKPTVCGDSPTEFLTLTNSVDRAILVAKMPKLKLVDSATANDIGGGRSIASGLPQRLSQR